MTPHMPATRCARRAPPGLGPPVRSEAGRAAGLCCTAMRTMCTSLDALGGARGPHLHNKQLAS